MSAACVFVPHHFVRRYRLAKCQSDIPRFVVRKLDECRPILQYLRGARRVGHLKLESDHEELGRGGELARRTQRAVVGGKVVAHLINARRFRRINTELP